MEPKYNSQVESNSESFFIERKSQPYFGSNSHYHDEYELFLNLKGSGVRVIGDNINSFKAPELLLMGRNLPHLFKNDEKNEKEGIDYIVLRFRKDFCGQSLFNLPELAEVKRLLMSSKRGIIYPEKVVANVKDKIIALSTTKGVDCLLLFITILKILSETGEYHFLTSEGFVNREDKIHKVMDYISKNYLCEITLEELAELSCMTPNSFCRFFKSRTKKTAFQVIREFRINKACQMLIEGERSISQICYDIGFNSISSFNRVFKNSKNISAREYKSKYII